MIAGSQPPAVARAGSDTVHQSTRRIPRSVLLLWLLAFFAMPVWVHYDTPGWDVAIYHAAIRALAAGHDPYADAIAVQQAFHSQLAQHPNADPPYSYVYSPITLPLLRLLGASPAAPVAGTYWLLYLAAVLAQIWIAFRFVQPHERLIFLYLAPLAPFFPGLLANGIVLGGNVAYLLYAAILLAALHAWKHNSWTPFYLIVLSASCVKGPLLSLVVIAILTARRQWLPTVLTTAAGLALFAMQPRIWPTLFAHYLQAVELQFSYNRDFGCSPAGLFSGILFDHHIPYSPSSLIFYAAYAIPLFGCLIYLSRLYLDGAFSLNEWFPVLLTGVILLNPRLIEYDVAPLALPLALIGWRFLTALVPPRRAAFLLAPLFVIANACALTSWTLRKAIDGPLIVALFLVGAWTLLHQSRQPTRANLSPGEASLQPTV